MPMTTYGEAMILQHTSGQTDRSADRPLAAPYLCFFTQDPTDDPNPAWEVANSTRQQITFGAPATVTGPPAGAQCTGPPSDISNISTAGWTSGTITHFTINAASTGSNHLYYGALDSPITFTAGDPLEIQANQIIVQLLNTSLTDNEMSEVGKFAWLNHLFRAGVGAAWTFTSNSQVALYTVTDPGDGTANEVSGGSGPYARQTYQPSTVTSGDPSTISNTNVITFNGMPAVTIESWGLWNGTIFSWVRNQQQRVITAGSNVEAQASTIILGAQ